MRRRAIVASPCFSYAEVCRVDQQLIVLNLFQSIKFYLEIDYCSSSQNLNLMRKNVNAVKSKMSTQRNQQLTRYMFSTVLNVWKNQTFEKKLITKTHRINNK